MKKLNPVLIFILFSVLFSLNSCDLIDELTDVTFESGYKQVAFTVYSNEAGVYTLNETYLQSDLEQEVENAGGDFDQIQSAKISESFVEVAVSGTYLDVFNWVEVYIGTNSQDEKKVAWITNIASGSTSVALTLSSDDIKDILKDDTYYVRVVGELGEDLLEDIDLIIRFKYEVNATVL